MRADDGDIELLIEITSGEVVVEGDVLEVATGVWALHGVITYDGEVILAEYDSPIRAEAALDRLALHTRSEYDQ